MEHLAAHVDWLGERLAPLLAADAYLIIDCPGQVELLTTHTALQQVVAALTERWNIRRVIPTRCALRMRR